MPDRDLRPGALRTFDACALDFAKDAAARIELGASLAARDVERIASLAERLADDVRAWGRALEDLDVGLETPLLPMRAGRLLIESVFDDALTAPAGRLLSAAFDLALNIAPGGAA